MCPARVTCCALLPHPQLPIWCWFIFNWSRGLLSCWLIAQFLGPWDLLQMHCYVSAFTRQQIGNTLATKKQTQKTNMEGATSLTVVRKEDLERLDKHVQATDQPKNIQTVDRKVATNLQTLTTNTQLPTTNARNEWTAPTNNQLNTIDKHMRTTRNQRQTVNQVSARRLGEPKQACERIQCMQLNGSPWIPERTLAWTRTISCLNCFQKNHPGKTGRWKPWVL